LTSTSVVSVGIAVIKGNSAIRRFAEILISGVMMSTNRHLATFWSIYKNNTPIESQRAPLSIYQKNTKHEYETSPPQYRKTLITEPFVHDK